MANEEDAENVGAFVEDVEVEQLSEIMTKKRITNGTKMLREKNVTHSHGHADDIHLKEKNTNEKVTPLYYDHAEEEEKKNYNYPLIFSDSFYQLKDNNMEEKNKSNILTRGKSEPNCYYEEREEKRKAPNKTHQLINKMETKLKDDNHKKKKKFKKDKLLNSLNENKPNECRTKGEKKYLALLKRIISSRNEKNMDDVVDSSQNKKREIDRNYNNYIKDINKDEIANIGTHSHIIFEETNENNIVTIPPKKNINNCIKEHKEEKCDESVGKKKKWNFKHSLISRMKHKAKREDVCQEARQEAQKGGLFTGQSSKQEHLKNKTKTNEQRKQEGIQMEDNNFIVYKVPRYLKKKNIKCPFVYRKVFFGKYGIVNYDLKGNKKGTLVITFHGLNGTNLTFLDMQKILIKYKFQVLNFDLYGHGLSACPKYNHRKKTYGIDFFLTQTEELLNHLKLLHKDFYLIGFSMGCVIAIGFAKKYIKQVKKIILISPVGILEKKPFALKVLKMFPCLINISSFFMLPCFISKKKFKHTSTRKNKRVSKSESNEASKNASNHAYYNDTQNDSDNDSSDYLYNRIMWQAFVKKNITHSILGCINNLKMWSAHEIFKEVGLNHIPVLILCGEKDNICSSHVFKNTSKLFINCHLIIFKNASHLVLVEKSHEINSCVLTFFHFPNNADLKTVHHMFPVDQVGNSVLYDQ
ncbi:alpha/beta hydrolase [Plasmodium gonderi]|uniref:Alpha/beta hydrolase n=1 Tax=Plasmodium gonderi TaxID=77519 RepID=A0A1Y1JGS9_PLAGO|nr:alpha/beta hydrolase [Plasmodium gonderi]GAW79643.1 alpha/beta hydrolase [Plasmodium gonderi]